MGSVSRLDLAMFASFFCVFLLLLALLVFRRGLVASPCALDCKSDFNFIQFQPCEVDELRHSRLQFAHWRVRNFMLRQAREVQTSKQRSSPDNHRIEANSYFE